jgi:hypothetical protein
LKKVAKTVNRVAKKKCMFFVKICVNSESLHMSLASAIAQCANIHAHCSIS